MSRPLFYCAAFLFGFAQQRKILLAFWIVFVKECRKYEENELMAKTSRRLNVESFDAEGS